MIKKVLFGLMWFAIIFIVSYGVIGIPSVLLTPGTNEAKREAALAFRDAYIVFFAIGSLILAILGTVAGILPGMKTKPGAKKKTSKKKKARRKK